MQAGMHEIAVNVIVHYKASASVVFINGLNALCGVFILHLLRTARGCCIVIPRALIYIYISALVIPEPAARSAVRGY